MCRGCQCWVPLTISHSTAINFRRHRVEPDPLYFNVDLVVRFSTFNYDSEDLFWWGNTLTVFKKSQQWLHVFEGETAGGFQPLYYFVFEIVLAYCIAVRYASWMVAARIATAKSDIHSRENHQLFSALLVGHLPIQMPLQIHKNHKTHGTQAKHCLLYCPWPGNTIQQFHSLDLLFIGGVIVVSICVVTCIWIL